MLRIHPMQVRLPHLMAERVAFGLPGQITAYLRHRNKLSFRLVTRPYLHRAGGQGPGAHGDADGHPHQIRVVELDTRPLGAVVIEDAVPLADELIIDPLALPAGVTHLNKMDAKRRHLRRPAVPRRHVRGREAGPRETGRKQTSSRAT